MANSQNCFAKEPRFGATLWPTWPRLVRRTLLKVQQDLNQAVWICGRGATTIIYGWEMLWVETSSSTNSPTVWGLLGSHSINRGMFSFFPALFNTLPPPPTLSPAGVSVRWWKHREEGGNLKRRAKKRVVASVMWAEDRRNRDSFNCKVWSHEMLLGELGGGSLLISWTPAGPHCRDHQNPARSVYKLRWV